METDPWSQALRRSFVTLNNKVPVLWSALLLTEMAQVCLWRSDGQTAIEGQPFQKSLKGSVGWKQGDSS